MTVWVLMFIYVGYPPQSPIVKGVYASERECRLVGENIQRQVGPASPFRPTCKQDIR